MAFTRLSAHVRMGGTGYEITGERIHVNEIGDGRDRPLQALARADESPSQDQGTIA